MKKAKFPAEAAALGITLFSGTMAEAMVIGSIAVSACAFARETKRILKRIVPEWSGILSVLTLTGIVCASAAELACAFLGWETTQKERAMYLILGLLCARYVLWKEGEDDLPCGQSAAVWGFWTAWGFIREWLSYGTVFGRQIVSWEIQSPQFQNVMFGFLASGMTLGFANYIFRTKQYQKNRPPLEALYVILPAVCYIQPAVFEFSGKWEWAGIGAAVFAALFLFWSVQKSQMFCAAAPQWRGLPAQLLSMGLIYMILDIY